ncbi:MAG: sucrase ferredoxin [Actinomycetota bacterium]
MSSDLDTTLLPAADESVRCAAHAESIDLDPGGTALSVDELIVVDVPLPWPKPVWAKDGFAAVPELVMHAGETGRRIRVLAAVPLDDGIGRVVTHRLANATEFARTEHQVVPQRVGDLLTVLLMDGLDASAETIASTEPVRELLLCTQGSHDICCGSRGPALEADLAAGGWTAVRRVSHTGGHRMAPTGVTLPDGRMWGLVTTAEMSGILRHDIAPAAVAARCRGWLGAEPGIAQMGERAAFAAADDWSFDATARTVAVADGTATVVGDAGTWFVDIEPGRSVPTIACGEPGGQPAKPGAEWRVTAVTRSD